MKSFVISAVQASFNINYSIKINNNLADIVTKFYLENTQKGVAGEVEEKALEILENIGG